MSESGHELSTDPFDWKHPDYRQIILERSRQLEKIRTNDRLLRASKIHYGTHPADFITDWMWTYDPRRLDGLKHMPFVLFPKQVAFIAWLHERYTSRTPGIVKKSREVGVTWLCVGYALASWLFVEGSKTSFGSRKEDLVDRLGDPDSIFEKLRMALRMTPPEFLPRRFNEDTDATFMKLINRENGATITGEAGKNIGRGGRSSLYVVDEAQPLTANVLTPSGWRAIGDLSLGASVIGPDGRARTVVGINDAGEHPVYRFKFSDGTTAECSPNHQWTVNKVLGGHWRITLRASEIAKTFVYHSPGGQTQFRYRLPRCAPVEFDAQALPLKPYLVGALIGDGCLARSQTSVTFTSADAEVTECVRVALPAGYTINHTARYDHRISHPRGRGARKRRHAQECVALLDALESLGMRGKLAQDKRIPRPYLLASPADRLELLRGLMDTDGCASGGRPSFHTCSPGLADDVLFLVRSLGGMASLTVKPDHRGYRDMLYVHVAMPEGVCPFHLTRKARSMSVRRQAFEKAIVGVEELPARQVRCITVDAEDGLYVTDGFAVTHNSAFLENPEAVDAALSMNTDTRIDVSSINGTGNPFHRKWTDGNISRFEFGWRDDPRKDDAWYEKKKSELDEVIVAREIDMDFNASVEGLCIPGKYVQAAVNLDLPGMDQGLYRAGLDVADEGGDKNAIVGVKGVLVLPWLDGWKLGTPAETAQKAYGICLERGVLLCRFDKVGVGAGVRGEAKEIEKRLAGEKRRVVFEGINTGDRGDALRHYGRFEDTDRKCSDMFANLRALLWWSMRQRFIRTYQHVNGIAEHPIEKLISIPNHPELISELSRPKVTWGEDGKIIIEPKKKMKGGSPNFADALLLCFAQKPNVDPLAHIG